MHENQSAAVGTLSVSVLYDSLTGIYLVLDKEQSLAPFGGRRRVRHKRFSFPVRAGLQHSAALKSLWTREVRYAALGLRV
jgi:hypothetical protein